MSLSTDIIPRISLTVIKSTQQSQMNCSPSKCSTTQWAGRL